ncbi:hypothetical protein CRUP_018913, partial [Coryphaenoides rupestris]
NGSCEDLKCFMILKPEERTAIGYICLLTGPVTLLENALVLGIIASTAALRHRPSYLFMGSLALADVFASFFYTISFVDFHLFCRNDGPAAYLFKLGGVTMSFTGSVGSLLLTALDRFLCLHRASRYKVLLTRRRALLALLLLWSTIIFVSFLPLMGWRCLTGLSPPCSRLFPYISRGYLACWTSGVLLQARMRMDIRLARTLGLILLILVTCWLPGLSLMLADVSMVLSEPQQRAFAFCSILCLVNSGVNPLLYALRCRDLRVALVDRLGCLLGLLACCRRSAGTPRSVSGQTQTEASRDGISSPDLGTYGLSQQEEHGGVGKQKEVAQGKPKVYDNTVNAS